MPRANKNSGLLKIENKRARYTGVIVALATYLFMIFLIGHVTRVRVHWLAAMLLEFGGPHLLALVVALFAGGFSALWIQVDADKDFFKIKK